MDANHIRNMAGKLLRRAPGGTDIEDLVQDGWVGYLQNPVSTARCYGEIMDGIRRAYMFKTRSNQSAEKGGKRIRQRVSSKILDFIGSIDIQRDSILINVIKSLRYPLNIVIFGYYFNDMNQEELGEVLGMSKSRVSQLHKSALWELKRRLL